MSNSEPDEARSRRISEAAVFRLPVYQRILGELLRSGETTVSSDRLAKRAQVKAAKVRKDLSFLGSFGTRGAGYDTAFLIAQIDRALAVDRDWRVAIVGMGNLGRALANSAQFQGRGFRISSLFDVLPEVVGTEVHGLVVRHIRDLGSLEVDERPLIGVIATPGEVAQGVANSLVGVGVRSILTFAPKVLSVPSGVLLRYIDLSIELQVLTFYASRTESESPGEVLPMLRSVGLGTMPRRP